MLHGRELLACPVSITHGVQCHHQFTGFGSGHPGAVVHAANTQTVDDEIAPAFGDPVVGGRTAYGTGQNRVVPIHRVTRLFGESVRVIGDRVSESAHRDLPFRLRMAEVIGEGQRTPDAVVDAGAPGQQGFGERAVRPLRPIDLAGSGLKIQHKVDRAAHGGPHPFGEVVVAGDQHVVPHSGGDVGAEVAIGVGILDHATAVLNRPGSVAALPRATPLVGGARLVNESGCRQCHGALDVIPRIGMAGQ